MISNEPVGKSESKYAKICSNNSLRNQIHTFLNFWLTIFKISYLINRKSFLLNLKYENWTLVSAIA